MAVTGKRDDLLNSLHNIPHHQGHLKLDSTRYLRTSGHEQRVLAQINQTPSPPSFHLHFILNPLFTLFANTSACLARLVTLPQGRLALVEDNIDAISCAMSAEREAPAPRFKAGQPRAALPLLTGTRLGAALGQIRSTC